MESNEDSATVSSSVPESAPETPPPTRLFPNMDESLVRADPEFRLTILRNYGCPFRVESTCRHEDLPNDCQFGHPQTAPIGRLLDIPDYVCIYHLLDCCKNPRKVGTVIQSVISQLNLILLQQQ